jgi:hypothetical protein
VKKTEDVLATHFFWPKMRHDVECYVSWCTTCNKGKSRLNPHGLYIPLPVPSVPWEDISMDCLEQRGEGMVFLWLSIVSLKWFILYRVTRAIMHHMLLICSSLRLFIYKVFQLLLSWIGMLNS